MNMDNNLEKLNDNELEQVAGGAAAGGTIASGSFASNTGTQLNLLVSWSVRNDIYGQKTLYVDVCATSISLYSGPTGVELTADGVTYAASATPVNYGGSTMVTNVLASFSIPNLSGPVNLSAVWHFNGSYSGVPIGDIRATGTATV